MTLLYTRNNADILTALKRCLVSSVTVILTVTGLNYGNHALISGTARGGGGAGRAIALPLLFLLG